MRRRLVSCLLVLCVLANLLVGFTALAAGTVSTGTVKADMLYVRSGPGTNHPVVGDLKDGDTVTIHKTVTNDSGERWYRISKDDLSGYAHSGYITVNATYETDEEFEAYLTAQSFPEDYKVALRQIHAQHPNWIFRANHLSMTWAEAYAAECKVGLNTVTSPDAWKSMEYGAYNWTTNTYVAYDSGGWVTAAPSVVAYYMDPRNWLDPTYIFQFEDLSYSDDQTLAGVQAILPDALDKHAKDLLKVSKEAKVSAYFLATRMAQEGSHVNGLGTGTVKGYKGYYNFFHIGAYEANGNSAVINGAIYAKKQGWDTPYKCLIASANSIGKGYIKLGQNTLYYQKFNFTNSASGLYAHQYMSNVAAPSSEGRIRRNAATAEQLKNNITFNIPVFKSMPTKAAPMPSKEGNNDNFLTDITITAITAPATSCSSSSTASTASSTAVTSDTKTAKESGTTAASDTKTAKTSDTTAASDTETAKTSDTPAASNTTTTKADAATETPVQLTPTFDRYTMSYSTDVGSATSVKLSATLSNPDAKLTGDGVIQLYKGGNEISLTVTATSGETRTYTIIVTTVGGVERPNAPAITGKVYTVTDTITKVEPDTTVAKFIKNLAVTKGTAVVTNAAGEKKKSGIVGTGDIVRLYSGNILCASYPIVIYGDVNGDGKITSLDLRVAQKHILKISAVDGYYLTAADSSKDGTLTSLDLRITQKYILKITNTLQ